MWMDKKYRPELCSAKDDTRPALTYLKVTSLNGAHVAIGADGFICAVVPVEMEAEDDAGLIHRSIFSYARSRPLISDGRIHLALGAYEVTFTNGWSAPRAMHAGYDGLEFPDIAPITARRKSDLRSVFGVNPDLLGTAAEAIGYDPYAAALYIHRDSETGPLVLAHEYTAASPIAPFALVMPLHLAGLPASRPKVSRAA